MQAIEKRSYIYSKKNIDRCYFVSGRNPGESYINKIDSYINKIAPIYFVSKISGDSYINRIGYIAAAPVYLIGMGILNTMNLEYIDTIMIGIEGDPWLVPFFGSLFLFSSMNALVRSEDIIKKGGYRRIFIMLMCAGFLMLFLITLNLYVIGKTTKTMNEFIALLETLPEEQREAIFNEAGKMIDYELSSTGWHYDSGCE